MHLPFHRIHAKAWLGLLAVATLVLAAQAQAKKVLPAQYRLLYGGEVLKSSGWSIGDSNGTVANGGALLADYDSVQISNSVPWFPLSIHSTITIPSVGTFTWLPRWVAGGSAMTVLYRDDAATIRALGSNTSAGLFAHLRWNPLAQVALKERSLFQLNFNWDTDERWLTQDNIGDINWVRVYLDSLNHLMVRTYQVDGKANAMWQNSRLYVRNTKSDGSDDSTYSDFDTSLVRSGWVGLEAKFTYSSSNDGVDVQLTLANRKLYTDTSHSGPVAKIPLPLTAFDHPAHIRPTLTGMSLWGEFLGNLGDALAIGQCKAADSSYEFSRKRFFTLERATDSQGKPIPADTLTEPSIADILYAPPGNTSSVSLTKSSTLSSSYGTENSLDANVTIGVGIEIEPEALTGECGVEVGVSASISTSLNKGSSVDGSVTTSQGWTLSGGSSDQVVYDMLRLRGFVLRHPRIDKLMDTGTIHDTDFVAYRVVVPDPQKSLQCVPVADFVSTYGKDAVAMAHLDSVYVKNRATGHVKADHPRLSGLSPSFAKYVGGTPVVGSGSVDITVTKTLTESYSLGVGVEASLKLTAGGFYVSASSSLDVSHTVGKSSSTSTEKGVSYSVSDNVPWNEFDYNYWVDPVYGNIVFDWDSTATYSGGYPSYSSAPWDGHSRKAVDLRYSYSFAQGASVPNQPLTCKLLVANKTQYSPRSISSILMPWIQNSIGVKENGSGYDYTASSNRSSAIKVDSGKTDTLVLTLTPPKDIVYDSITLVIPYGYQNTNFVHVGDDNLTVRLPARNVSITTRRPTPAAVSHEFAADIHRSFASRAQGTESGQLGTSASCGADRCQSVEIVLPSAASVQVSIFDILGTPVISWNRDLSEFEVRQLAASGDGRRILPVSWNARAWDGSAVQAGVYLWKITVVGMDGQKLETVKKLGVR